MLQVKTTKSSVGVSYRPVLSPRWNSAAEEWKPSFLRSEKDGWNVKGCQTLDLLDDYLISS